MKIEDFYTSPCMRYWQPDKSKHIELDIVEHPEKYKDYIGSYKKDGEWSRVIFNGEKVIIQSRSISKVTGEYGRKEELVPHLVKLFETLPKDTVLLGELYFQDLNCHSKDVGSILRCLPPKAIARQKNNPLCFYCFDVLMFNGIDLTQEGYENRVKYFNEVSSLIGQTSLIQYAEIKTVDNIIEEYDEYLNQGGEGFVLQRRDNKYNPGTRTAWSTIKLKKATDEIELPVVDIIWPNKNYEGKELDTWKYFINSVPVTKRYFYSWANGVVVNNNGTLVSVTSGLSDEDAEWLSTQEAKSLIDNHQLFVIIQAMEIEKDTGSLRHPILKQLRTDL